MLLIALECFSPRTCCRSLRTPSSIGPIPFHRSRSYKYSKLDPEAPIPSHAPFAVSLYRVASCTGLCISYWCLVSCSLCIPMNTHSLTRATASITRYSSSHHGVFCSSLPNRPSAVMILNDMLWSLIGNNIRILCAISLSCRIRLMEILNVIASPGLLQ
ncbi:hypothetical protein EDB81DRAFT_809988 [Dactylonectria macrodidyma]|uniref:Uncharacterized protein n=1 Tax=Dactylonectria macrodidyma TaxID=307937 RepID=A0A9P9INQ2_9HYPO|nr:hypothetical protein EDB81DRAFT_809988 [Dactylonectria macrodidyma]